MGGRGPVELQVQLCLYGPEGMKRLLAAEHPEVSGVSWLVSWQLPEGPLPVPEEIRSRDDFEVIISHDRGLSRNRNHALDYPGDAPLILIGDDDVSYSAEALRELIATFRRHPREDVVCCRYTCFGEYTKPYGHGEISLARPPFGWYLTSFELAMRRSCLNGLRFNENLGLGSPRLVAGEETVFLHDLLRRGARGIMAPIDIGSHDHATTGERLCTDPSFLFTHGAVLTHIHPCTWPLRLLLHAWRTQMPFLTCLRHTLSGAFYAFRAGIF